MATTVEMPKLGNTVEECLLTAWLKHKGDAVAAGDILAEVETDKATFEVTAPTGGILLDTFFDEGALVPVYTGICVIGTAGESADTVPPAGGPAPSASSQAAAQVPEQSAKLGTAPPSAPAQPRVLAQPTVPGQPSPPDQAVVPRRASAPGQPSAGRSEARSAALSPRARRFAREHAFRPVAVAGTGPGGRVVEADVRKAFQAQPRVSAAAAQELATGSVPDAEGSGIGGMIRVGDLGNLGNLGEPVAPLSAVRQRIAARLRESLSSTAQYTLNGSANAAGLLAVRRTMKASPATAGITINDLVAFCTVRALQQAPELNAEFADGVLREHAAIHLAFACDTDRGLIVPVICDSQRMSLIELSGRMRDLTDLAVRGTIGPDDLTGGTFTISNLGALGVESFTPVLNPPQVAILGVDAIQVRPARKADGNIEFIDAIGLSLTLDHQVIDGAPGARFLSVLEHAIENAETLCMT